LWAAILLEPTTKSSTLDDQYLVSRILTQIKDLIQEFDVLF
jgi:hypothetical protein